MEAGGRKSKAVRAVASHELVGRTERAFFIENEPPKAMNRVRRDSESRMFRWRAYIWGAAEHCAQS
jgi:hypothetical protein